MVWRRTGSMHTPVRTEFSIWKDVDMMFRKSSKTFATLAAAGLIAASLGGAALVALPAAAQPLAADADVQVTTVKATVEAIDAKTRQVTLKGPDGNLATVKAGDAVKNFNQIAVGDTVTITRTDALVADIAKPAKGAGPSISVTQIAGKAAPGQKPSAGLVDAITVTGEIVRLDAKAHTATIKGPEGRLYTLTAVQQKHQQKLAKVKVGDLIQVTFLQSIAVAVTK